MRGAGCRVCGCGIWRSGLVFLEYASFGVIRVDPGVTMRSALRDFWLLVSGWVLQGVGGVGVGGWGVGGWGLDKTDCEAANA